MNGAWDFSKAEGGIVAKLKADLQNGAERWAREIATRKEMAAITEDVQNSPAVYVVFDGFSVIDATESDATLLNRWYIVLALKNAAAQRKAAPLNQDAGPYLAAIWKSLHGYTPTACRTPLVPFTPPKPYFSDAKFAYYALAFSTQSFHCTTPHYF